MLAILAAHDKDTPMGFDALDRAGDHFRFYKADFHDAVGALVTRGLIAQSPAGLRLASPAARALARRFAVERPDMYYYYFRDFYARAGDSPTYAEYCRRAYGADLCQQGMTDMAQLTRAVAAMALAPGQRVLDLGCGSGGLSAHIAETTGADVTGIDQSEAAIDLARRRFGKGQENLRYLKFDLNDLGDLRARPKADAAFAADGLYWVADMAKTLTDLRAELQPSGRIAVLMSHRVTPDQPDDPGATRLGEALAALGWAHEVEDLTADLVAFWARVMATTEALMPEFEAEGIDFIAHWIRREGREGFLPFIEAGTMRRYLFLIRV